MNRLEVHKPGNVQTSFEMVGEVVKQLLRGNMLISCSSSSAQQTHSKPKHSIRKAALYPAQHGTLSYCHVNFFLSPNDLICLNQVRPVG